MGELASRPYIISSPCVQPIALAACLVINARIEVLPISVLALSSSTVTSAYWEGRWNPLSSQRSWLVVAWLRAGSGAGQRQMSRDDIAAIVAAIADLARVVSDADPADKADIYAQLGLSLTYQTDG